MSNPFTKLVCMYAGLLPVMVYTRSGNNGGSSTSTAGASIKDDVETVVSLNLDNARVCGKNLDISSTGSNTPVSLNIIPQLLELMNQLILDGNSVVLSANNTSCTDPDNIATFLENVIGKDIDEITELDLKDTSINVKVSKNNENVEYKLEVKADYDSLLERVEALEATDFTTEDYE